MEFLLQDTLAKFSALFGGLPREELDLVAEILEVRAVKRGETLLKAGDAANEIGIVARGLFKMHGTSPGGTPFVVAFADEGMLVSDYIAAMREYPATLTIEALENSVVAVMPIAQLQALYEHRPEWQSFARRILESHLNRLAKREYEFLTMTAVERYQSFFRSHVKVTPRITRQDLAAYLGITPASLSRLTAKSHEQRRQPQSGF